MAIEIQAPHDYEHLQLPTIFLAGSIDNGKAIDWQKWLIEQLAKEDVLLLNPRRSDWNSKLACDSEQVEFRKQVEWELTGLRNADWIVIYFAPDSKAPISLLELGLFASSKKVCVCCPEGYWRKGNVDIVCEQYDILQVNTLTDLLKQVQLWLQEKE